MFTDQCVGGEVYKELHIVTHFFKSNLKFKTETGALVCMLVMVASGGCSNKVPVGADRL